ncbi:MAG: MipA/OmpV family protein [Hyphomicrobium sp.]|nr:MipA/OmpV family protein [Hyphomicrobium sp.]
MITSRTGAAIALSATLVFSAPASAGGFGDFGDLELRAGGVVFVAPKYEGSDEYEVLGFPMIAPSGSGFGDDGVVQFRGPDDLRFRVLNFSGFEAGPLVGYRFDREEDDADRLEGLGDVDGGVVLGGYAAYRLGFVKPFVSYNHAVSGDETGGLLKFGAESVAPVWHGVTAKVAAGATYADDDYMNAFFSVTPAQSANSAAGLGVYDAEAGIKDVFVGFSSDVPLSERWTLMLMGRYAHLVGDAAESPIVESDSQFMAGVGLTYRFGFGR